MVTQNKTHSKFVGYNVKSGAQLVLAAFFTYLCDLRLNLSLFLGDLRFDLTKIVWLRFDLRFDLTKFEGWWLDLRFDMIKV